MAGQRRGKSARAQERKAVAVARRAEGTGWGWWCQRSLNFDPQRVPEI